MKCERNWRRKFSIHPISVIVWVWLAVVMGAMQAFSYVVAIIVHELGHFCIAKKCGYKLSRFSLSPYGVSLSYLEQGFNHKDEFWIALAGPVLNLLASLVVVGLWWLVPGTYFFSVSFVETSVLLALFNLLPAYPMDGGRIFICFFSNFVDERNAKKFTLFVNLILSLLFAILFVVFCFVNFNPTFLLMSIFLFVGVVDLKFETKFEKINIFCKNEKPFSKPVLLSVNGDVTIGQILAKFQTCKTNIFCLTLGNGRVINLSEKMIINLSLNYPIETKLCQIFEKSAVK
ncbi:MAG: hypothetical protein J6K39_03115 [Clostridia bacterium]|nr:hypothetical protein [Clostridia bacterium]